MSSMTQALKDALAAAVFRNAPYKSPSALYVGLFLKSPAQLDGGEEVSAPGYARALVTFGADLRNLRSVEFPMALGFWGLVKHFGIFDAPSGGGLLVYAELDDERLVSRGIHFVFEPGAISVGYEVGGAA